MDSGRSAQLSLRIQLNHPALLKGLDVWLQLGLISDSQVRNFCLQNLTCALLTTSLSKETTIAHQVGQLEAPIPPSSDSPRVPAPQISSPPQQQGTDWLTHILQSLMAELSVLWLLLLGVFMVVVSSGVLAATQWRYLVPAGQYGLLLAYTLVFAAVAYGLERRPQLQLTARMLQVTTLLLIPVNFWMMDQLNLFRSGGGWLVAALSALTLTGILGVLLRLSRGSLSTSLIRITTVNIVGLSWLHWGWEQPGWPWFATYGGMLATCIALTYEDNIQEQGGAVASEEAEDSLPSLLGWMQPSRIAVIGGLLLLLFRAIVVAQIPISKMGLAIALGGWLLCWLSRRSLQPWFWLGVGLLIMGRWAALAIPGQALAISVLALWIFGERLRRRSKVLDLVCLFFIGLQTCWPLTHLVSAGLRQQVVSTAIEWAPTEVGMPMALWGVGLFPYCLLTLWLGSKLRQRSSGQLTETAEGLALGMGLILTIISFLNPLTRSLNLILSALTLSWVVCRRPQARSFLLYLTQFAGLSAIFANIDFGFPRLSLAVWASICLGAMMAEWVVSGWVRASRWQESAWNLGLGLAAVSYVLWSSENMIWRVSWLMTPVMLTLLGTRSGFQRPKLAAGLGMATLVVAQPLTFAWTTPRLLGLAGSTVLTFFNTRTLKHPLAGGLTIGFGLSFVYAALWELRQGQISLGLFSNWVAATALLLWLLHGELQRRGLGRWYIKALSRWAWGLNTLNLLGMNLCLGLLYSGWDTLGPSPQYLIGATGLATLAISYHSWQNPSESSRFQVAVSLEVLMASLLLLRNASIIELAIANLALGILSLGIGKLWRRQNDRPYWASEKLIPLLYGSLGWVFGHSSFSATTGIYTLIFSLIAIGVSRRQVSFKGMSYLAIAGLSWGAYELLIYQLLQAIGGRVADGWLMFAVLGTVIAYSEYVLAPWLARYVKLSVKELQIIAHLHWTAASGLAFLALVAELSTGGEPLWIGVTSGLACYAFIQGRRREGWIYAGILETIAALGYGLYLTVPMPFLQHWGAAIACLLAAGVYRLPWSTWGWPRRPWRQTAFALPLVATLTTANAILIPTLLIAGAFYAWLAMQERRPQLSYLSIFFADWAIWRLLDIYQLQGQFAIACLVGGSLLYIAQIDPVFKTDTTRNQRHLLRTMATSLMCLSALAESDAQLLWGFAAAGCFLLLVLSGLILRVRAFAYVGSLFFVLKVGRQLWLFVADQSFLLWAIGIVVGLLFIWVAATFEARRSQMTALLNYWVDELRTWA
ncbi:hypothetical protein C1752_14378 [Acaryochloris thomasi RCC1774]|uniref:DUF2157 domain-containing protein n=1 Tax=Acaryochloris thomasi RCC1774 TaxID=1764569 RepID=A0A2W1JLX9_9CYAN|nr:hypothetical protein [Acaryochloris thomasi]PZD70291.1 hypothetical protein C1752_14378 [Acaryochloris thomasi RCC1774]